MTPELPVTRLPDAMPGHFRTTQSGNEAGVSTLYVPYVSPALSYVPYVSPTVQLLLLSLPQAHVRLPGWPLLGNAPPSNVMGNWPGRDRICDILINSQAFYR